jgi:hypothetical protein
MTTEVLGSTTAKPEPPAPWIPTDSTFGARLALIRQHMAWGNVKEAALACGLPPESWRTWERDGVEPRGLTRIARQISNAVGCDYGWLVGGPALSGRWTAGGQTPYCAPLPDRPRGNRPPNRRSGPDSGPGRVASTEDTRRPARRRNPPSVAPLPRAA